MSKRRVLWAATAFLISSLCVAVYSHAHSATSLKDYNLIFINIDALRADHLGCYGYTRDTSPFIDSLTAKGVVFERAMSNSSYTRESVSALLSGLLPSTSGSVGWNAKPTGDTQNLGELLRNAGYVTGFFDVTTMLTDPQFVVGFDEFQHLTGQWGASGLGFKLSARALAFATAHAREKFMMYLHYLDPHGPYDPPPQLYKRLANKSLRPSLNLYTDVRPNCMALVQEGFGPGEARFEEMVMRYDAEIADTDRSIARLFSGLEKLHLLDRTLVIIAADHGEEFLEHGFVEHAWTLYGESLHIPLVLWAPGRLKPARIGERVSVVDILPTVLELLEVPHSRPHFDGSALLRRRGGTPADIVPTRPAVAELLVPARSVLRTVIVNDWKYIGAQKWLPPAERAAAVHHARDPDENPSAAVDIWGPVVHEELYNLADDPHEQRNLLGSEEGKHRELAAVLASHTAAGRQRAHSGGTGNSVQALSDADKERLKALGYLQE